MKFHVKVFLILPRSLLQATT